MTKEKKESEEPKEKTTRPLDPIVAAKRALADAESKERKLAKYVQRHTNAVALVEKLKAEYSQFLKAEQEKLGL